MRILEAKNLLKRYGRRTVVNDVSFDVAPGEIVGLLGRNGAGKTTSFRMVAGMIGPDGGKVLFNGHDVTALPMYQRARLGMGYLAQEPSIFRKLSVRENLMAILETTRGTRVEQLRRADELMAQFGLTKLADQGASLLSGGERRKLEIARCLITNPSLVLLDEPFSGVDPRMVEDFQAQIRELRAQRHIAMLVTDHNVHHILALCDRAYVIFDGVVFASGTPKEIINNKQVRENYLGSSFKGDEFDR